MSRLALTTALMMTTASAAVAGPIEVPPPLPPVIVHNCPMAFDCFYAGVEVGFGDGYVDEEAAVAGAPPISRTLTFDGEAYGAFAGYNFQNGNTVYGGEVRYLHLNLTDASGAFEIDSVLDLRGRVGIAGDQLLVYGAAGWSIAQASGAGDFDMSGFNYGVGVEYNVNASLFLGADVTGRQVEGSVGGFDYDSILNTATLRAGFRF